MASTFFPLFVGFLVLFFNFVFTLRQNTSKMSIVKEWRNAT